MHEYENNGYATGENTTGQLKADVKDGARQAKNAIVDAVSEGAQGIEDAVQPAYERLVDGLDSFAENATRTLEQTRSIVRDYPIASLATMAVASIALARLLRR